MMSDVAMAATAGAVLLIVSAYRWLKTRRERRYVRKLEAVLDAAETDA